MQRTYKSQDGCPIAGTLDVIGDRWTILVLRDLLMGRASKFTELLESLQGISPNLLARRLKRLEEQGIVDRFFYSDHPPRAEYRLTQKGEHLAPVIGAIAEWGVKYCLDDEDQAASALHEVIATLGVKREPAEPAPA